MIKASNLGELRAAFNEFNKGKLEQAKANYLAAESKRAEFIEALKELHRANSVIDNEITKEYSRYEAFGESIGIDRAEIISALPISLTSGVAAPKALAKSRAGEY
jgi:hypothetical protein